MIGAQPNRDSCLGKYGIGVTLYQGAEFTSLLPFSSPIADVPGQLLLTLQTQTKLPCSKVYAHLKHVLKLPWKQF
jgi:hypothetical protein